MRAINMMIVLLILPIAAIAHGPAEHNKSAVVEIVPDDVIEKMS